VNDSDRHVPVPGGPPAGSQTGGEEVTNLPDRPTTPGRLVERRLTNRDFELVIRRAAELQAREAEGVAGDGITEVEALRIGRELGLSAEHLHRALAEVGDTGPPESGLLASLFGPRTIHAARALPGDAESIARQLEQYLLEREYLAVLRRFGDRVVFTRASGVVAAMGRATSQIFSRSPRLGVDNLELSVRSLEDGYAHVYVATSLRGPRTATAATSMVGGATGAGIVGAVLGIAVAPPAALVALPVLGVSLYGGKVYYERLAYRTHVQLESLLDRLEHGELPQPTRGWSYPRREPPT
jgi:hypothetical protein